MHIPQTECCICDRPFKVGDLVQKVYTISENEVTCDTHPQDSRFVHLKCPGKSFKDKIAEKWEIVKDNSSDAVCMPLGGGSEAAMDYVQEQNEPKEK